jgi:hypothetical protein
MKTLQKYIFGVLVLFLLASPVSAATLSVSQINSIISLLQAFNVSQSTLNAVYGELLNQPVNSDNSSSQTTLSPSLIVGSMDSIQTPSPISCVPNPVMTLATSSVTSYGTTKNSITVDYITGCFDDTGAPDGTGTLFTVSELMNPYIDNTTQLITGRVLTLTKYTIVDGQNDTYQDGHGGWTLNPNTTVGNFPSGVPITLTIGNISTTTQF